jgi:hypothetical protein
MSGEDDGFLGRWARRKREAERAAERAETAPPPEVAAEPAPEAVPEPEADPELLASLPRLEDITGTTDIKVFLQKGVPAALRNAALRRAWAADPVISTYEDPARDYFWDWNAPGGVPGGGGTLNAERVAKMVRDLAGKDDSEMNDSSAETPPTPPGDEPGEPENPAVAAVPADAPAPPDATEALAQAPAPAPASTKPDPMVPPRRRHGGALPG